MSNIPYSCQEIDEEDITAVVSAMRSDYLTQGPQIASFESAFGGRHDTAHAVAVSNATAGLHIACLALGVDQGSLVWTSPNSFLASANCALYCGAGIDFVDIDPDTRNMSVDALREKLEDSAKRNIAPDVVIPVHFGGLPCDMREIRGLADRYGFRILEDASHATGASYLGRPVGSAFADATVFSFHAVKILTTAEGGMVTTQDPEIARRLTLLRSHGMTRDPGQMQNPSDDGWYYEQVTLGFNYRLTDLQAALGNSQLLRLDDMHARRISLADRYDSMLGELPVIRPARLADRQSAWHLYPVEIDETATARSRRDVFAGMRAAGIGVNVHYIPIHTQPFYQRLGFNAGDFPAAERYYRRTISLPLFPRMTEAHQQRVVDALRTCLT